MNFEHFFITFLPLFYMQGAYQWDDEQNPLNVAEEVNPCRSGWNQIGVARWGIFKNRPHYQQGSPCWSLLNFNQTNYITGMDMFFTAPPNFAVVWCEEYFYYQSVVKWQRFLYLVFSSWVKLLFEMLARFLVKKCDTKLNKLQANIFSLMFI